MYKVGGRKFGFLNIGAYDCAPASLIIDQTNIGSCFKPITDLINLHNKKLPNVLKLLERDLSGFKYALHDYHTSLSERINNPLKYGKSSHNGNYNLCKQPIISIFCSKGLKKGRRHVVVLDR